MSTMFLVGTRFLQDTVATAVSAKKLENIESIIYSLKFPVLISFVPNARNRCSAAAIFF